ncbi:beta-propeller fold lactonase family protein [Candidatus Poribacteria bacterium]|nr:beta-propeller fold lactonase family protein [Candidatus Poribacteria bacterium]
MKTLRFLSFQWVVLFCICCFFIIISGCGKKSNSTNGKKELTSNQIATAKLYIKWPIELKNKKQRSLHRIPNPTQSIKLSITGTNIKNPIELIVNKDEQNTLKEINLEIPVGLTYFKIIAFDQFNAGGKSLAYGEVVYNILSGIINEIKISLEQYPQSISLSVENNLQIKLGQIYQIIANAIDADGFTLPKEKITWQTDNNSIALIDDTGKVTGINEGITYITAAVREISVKIQIQVIDIKPVSNFSVLPGNSKIELTWGKSKSTNSYLIYYNTNSGVLLNEQNFLVETTDTTYIHNGLLNGTKYYYVIVSVNGNISEPSQEAYTSPTDSFLYTACANSIDEFAIDKKTGDLYKIGSEFALIKSDPKIDKNIAISINKKMLYVLSGYDSGKIYQFSIDDAFGKLTYVTEIETGLQPRDIKITSDGKAVFITNYKNDTLSRYSIMDDGRLSWDGDSGTGSGPNSIAIDPLNKIILLANYKNPYYLYSYKLTDSLPKYFWKKTVLKNITSMIFSSDGNFIYAASDTENAVNTYSVQEDSTLILMDSTYAGDRPSALAISTQKKFMYSISYDSNYIISYKLDNNTGCPSKNAVISCGSGPLDIAITTDENFIYIANSKENTISIYEIDPMQGKPVFLKKIATDEKPCGLCFFEPIPNTQMKISIE